MTDRQLHILKELVDLFVREGTPVSSRALAARFPLGLSAPSIRLELAELEQQGYVEQPHISSGRIPTAKGFREVFRDITQEPSRPSHTPATFGDAVSAVPHLAKQVRLVAFGGDILSGHFCIVGFQYLR